MKATGSRRRAAGDVVATLHRPGRHASFHAAKTFEARLVATVALVGCTLTSTARADEDPWVAPDKGAHFGVSVAVSAAAYGVSTTFLDERWQRAVTAASFSLALGAGKEAYDATGRGAPSGRDFAWDALGTAVGVGLAVTIDVLVHRNRRDEPEPAAAALVTW